MASSLSDPVNNLAEKRHKIRYKYGHENAKNEKLNAKIESAILITQMIQVICYNTNVCYNKNYQKMFDKGLR